MTWLQRYRDQPSARHEQLLSSGRFFAFRPGSRSEPSTIEMIAYGLEDDPAAPTDVPSIRSYMEGRLTTLNCKVLDGFAAGGLKGEGLMAGIIALINDTRGSLAGMAAAPNGAPQTPAADKMEKP